MNLVDTSGWIEFFFGEPNADYFADPIEDVGSLIVSTICLYEVHKKVHQVSDETHALRAVAQMRQGNVIPVTEGIALRAALVSREHKLPMANSLIYATGQVEGAVIWTQDEDFNGLPGVNYKQASGRARRSKQKK